MGDLTYKQKAAKGCDYGWCGGSCPTCKAGEDCRYCEDAAENACPKCHGEGCSNCGQRGRIGSSWK